MALVLLNGCGRQETDRPDALARISFEEIVRVDGQEHDLVSINRSALSTDGTIAIGQPQVGTVLLFDRDGRGLGSVGSLGEGPGEFSTIGEIGWWGPDTLWVYDSRQRRLTSFSRRPLRHLETQSMHPLVPKQDEGWFRVLPLGLARDQGLLFRGVRGGPSSSIEALGIRGPGNGETRLLLTAPRVEEMVTLEREGTRLQIALPWTLASLFGVSPDGRRVASLVMRGEEDRIGVATTEVNADGDTIFSTGTSFVAMRVTDAAADSALREVAGHVSPRMRAALGVDVEAAYLRAASLPPVLPAFSHIVVGLDGSVWQRVEQLASYEPGAYLWMDGSGAIGGVGRLPKGRIVEADEASVWSVETDSFGVPSLVAYAYSVERE